MSTQADGGIVDQWKLAIPERLTAAWKTLEPGDEVGVWQLSAESLDPNSLAAGAPINLFPIGLDGMGASLCLHLDCWDDNASPRIVMWNPESLGITRLGTDIDDFFERESQRRLDFLLGRVDPLPAEVIAKARAGEQVSFEQGEGDTAILQEMVADVCRVAGKLGLSESVFARAAGSEGTPDYLREVDGNDEAGIDSAMEELRQQADRGDAAAAFEVLGFLQLRQKPEDAARWAYALAKCSLYEWPGFSVGMLTKLTEVLKTNSASVPAVERLDPLFSFMTTQPTAKVDGRLKLAKDYLRQKKPAFAVREAENAVRLSFAGETDPKPAYTLLAEIFRTAGRPREQAYAELMLGKCGS